MKKRVKIERLLFSCLFLLLGITGTTYADNAEVLPEGISRVVVDGKFYFPTKKRYNPDGKAEDIATDLNTDLDSSVFDDLVPFGAGATLGVSEVSYIYDVYYIDISYQYGVSDKLTIGINIPYWSAKNNVSTNLDTSAATIGKIAAAPYLWPIVGGGTALTTEDVLDLISDGLDTTGDGVADIPGFGYKRVATWSGSGIADVEIGGRYQYRDSDRWRLAFTGALRLPTGEQDDPDSLVDIPQKGSGTYSFSFKFNNDYKAIENLLLNATIGYEMVLPAKVTLRVPDDVNMPLTKKKEKVKRDIGDVLIFEGSASYKLSDSYSVFTIYRYRGKQKDSVSGDQGFAYEALEAETDTTEQIAIIGATYSTIHRYRAKTFPIPLMATLSYRDRFAGTNNVNQSQYIGLSITSFF